MSLSKVEEYIETGNHQDLALLLSQSPEALDQETSQGVSPLLLACYYDKPQIIQTILQYCKTITFHEACAVGLLEPVKLILENEKEKADEFSEDGFSPLGLASHFGHADVVRYLLLKDADPNAASENGYNVYPLHSALSNQHNDVAKLLIESGANINVMQHGGITPLHLAASTGNIELIILLLEFGADITLKNEWDQNASDIAAENGFKEIAEILKTV